MCSKWQRYSSFIRKKLSVRGIYSSICVSRAYRDSFARLQFCVLLYLVQRTPRNRAMIHAIRRTQRNTCYFLTSILQSHEVFSCGKSLISTEIFSLLSSAKPSLFLYPCTRHCMILQELLCQRHIGTILIPHRQPSDVFLTLIINLAE